MDEETDITPQGSYEELKKKRNAMRRKKYREMKDKEIAQRKIDKAAEKIAKEKTKAEEERIKFAQLWKTLKTGNRIDKEEPQPTSTVKNPFLFKIVDEQKEDES